MSTGGTPFFLKFTILLFSAVLMAMAFSTDDPTKAMVLILANMVLLLGGLLIVACIVFAGSAIASNLTNDAHDKLYGRSDDDDDESPALDDNEGWENIMKIKQQRIQDNIKYQKKIPSPSKPEQNRYRT